MNTKELPAGVRGGADQRAGTAATLEYVAYEDVTTVFGICQSPTSPRVPIRASTGRVVGHVHGGVFVKYVRGSVHMLRKPRAWALDVQSLDDAEAAGARQVAITDTESGITYRASIAQIRRYGVPVNRGHGRQIALPLDLWDMERADAPVQLALELGG